MQKPDLQSAPAGIFLDHYFPVVSRKKRQYLILSHKIQIRIVIHVVDVKVKRSDGKISKKLIIKRLKIHLVGGPGIQSGQEFKPEIIIGDPAFHIFPPDFCIEGHIWPIALLAKPPFAILLDGSFDLPGYHPFAIEFYNLPSEPMRIVAYMQHDQHHQDGTEGFLQHHPASYHRLAEIQPNHLLLL
jgi:hypothetical protein